MGQDVRRGSGSPIHQPTVNADVKLAWHLRIVVWPKPSKVSHGLVGDGAELARHKPGSVADASPGRAVRALVRSAR